MKSFSEIEQYQTPNFLSDLGEFFLGIGEGEKVADLACGTGEFLKYVEEKFQNVSLYGCDVIDGLCESAKSKFEKSSKMVQIECRDAFSIPDDAKFDRIFIHPPFGMKVDIDGNIQKLLKKTLGEDLKINKMVNADLLFAVLATQHLKDDGCAVVIVSASSCSNKAGKLLRKFLVDEGYLGEVISLPGKLLTYTSVPITALSLRKHCEGTQMIDGLGFDNKRGRKELVEGIGVGLLDAASQIGAEEVFVVKRKDIVDADYDIYPSKFCDPPFSYKYKVPLSSVLQVLRRGVVNGSKARCDFKNKNPKTREFPFVRASNIDFAVFTEKLNKIGEEFLPTRRICLKKGDILLTKTGGPFKCAVVDDLPIEDTYFQENLYLLRVDREKIDPYFLCAFFNSLKGQKMLSRAMVSGGTSSIPIKILKEQKIPLPNFENQKEIADYFKDQVSEIKDLKKHINDVIDDTKLELMYYF